jgi:hypothetical protein|tara:strand:+ start:512 stop:751 length:240 start_codon:yes stop_codon:yes gene_type:complete
LDGVGVLSFVFILDKRCFLAGSGLGNFDLVALFLFIVAPRERLRDRSVAIAMTISKNSLVLLYNISDIKKKVFGFVRFP